MNCIHHKKDHFVWVEQSSFQAYQTFYVLANCTQSAKIRRHKNCIWIKPQNFVAHFIYLLSILVSVSLLGRTGLAALHSSSFIVFSLSAMSSCLLPSGIATVQSTQLGGLNEVTHERHCASIDTIYSTQNSTQSCWIWWTAAAVQTCNSMNRWYRIVAVATPCAIVFVYPCMCCCRSRATIAAVMVTNGCNTLEHRHKQCEQHDIRDQYVCAEHPYCKWIVCGTE